LRRRTKSPAHAKRPHRVVVAIRHYLYKHNADFPAARRVFCLTRHTPNFVHARMQEIYLPPRFSFG
jgi:hypothetical protein